MGNIPRGTLYGVYDFLHEELGCRFLAPEVNHVPSKPTLKVAGELGVQVEKMLYAKVEFFLKHGRMK